MSAKVVRVILVQSERAGKGDSEADPVRILQQFYTLDGRLICQFDPIFPESRPPTGHGGTLVVMEPRAAEED